MTMLDKSCMIVEVTPLMVIQSFSLWLDSANAIKIEVSEDGSLDKTRTAFYQSLSCDLHRNARAQALAAALVFAANDRIGDSSRCYDRLCSSPLFRSHAHCRIAQYADYNSIEFGDDAGG